MKPASGKLAGAQHAGNELRAALRDPRRFQHGKGRLRVDPLGKKPYALGARSEFRVWFWTVALAAPLAVIAVVVTLGATGMDLSLSGAAAGWVAPGLVGLTVVVVTVIVWRTWRTLTDAGPRSAEKPRDRYGPPQALPKDCGVDDWWSEDVRFVIGTFWMSLIHGAVASGVLLLVISTFPDAAVSDSAVWRAIAGCGVVCWVVGVPLGYSYLAERRHPRLMD